MQEQHASISDELRSKLKSHGKCLIPGNIYDLGRYPGLKLDDKNKNVHGELYEIIDRESVDWLDEYEAHDNFDKTLPGFTRRLVELDFPKQLAWVYEYDGEVDPKLYIESGKWE